MKGSWMSLQTADNFLMYALYCLPLVVILAIYFSRQKRVHKHNRRVQEETVSAGLTEPASLHPIIDASRCLGCGACVKACP